MSTFKFKDHSIYFEIHGEGEPLLILNGIMMSTASWTPFLDTLTKFNQVVLVDFLDQGQSSTLDNITYSHSVQIEVVHQLLQHLSIKSVNLFGISYGGEIAIQFSLKHPQFIKRLLLFNTTAWTSPWLQEIGDAWNKASSDPENYYSTTIPVIYSPTFYNNNIEWMKRRKEVLLEVFARPKFINAMVRLTNSSVGYDVRKDIHKITAPTLVVASDTDFVTPIEEQRYLAKHIPNSSLVVLENSGHASMYEHPEVFVSLVLGFVNTPTLELVI